MQGTLQASRSLSNCPEGATFSRLGLRKSVESYLCDPAVVEDISRRLGTGASVITVAQMEEELRCFAADKLVQTTARRAFRRMGLSQDLSLTREVLSRISSYDQLSRIMLNYAKSMRKTVAEDWTDVKIKLILRREYHRCEGAVKAGESTSILRLFEGKEILARLLPRLGLNSPAALVNAVFAHLDVEQHSKLRELRDRIRLKLGISTASSDRQTA
jgi:hypothetical protein